jgi:NADPH2:quinone reductase
MKSCWVITRDHAAVLEWRDVPIPEPAAGEVLIRVRATAMNRGELIVGGAVHGGPEKIGGTEAAGEVHAIGKGVTSVRPGDRIFGRVRGGFAEYTLLPAHQAMPVPPRLSFEQAAAIPVSYITAYEALYPPYGKLKSGEWMLVAGASAGAGVASIQIASMLGARTIGISRSHDKLERLKAIGLEVPIVMKNAAFADEVRRATGGHGADVIVNLVGGSAFPECVRCLARRGRLAVIGYVDGGLTAEIDLAAVHAQRLEIFGVSNAKLTSEERTQAVSGFARDVLPAIADGRITPLIDRTFGFDELAQAKAWMEANAMVGKIAVRVA